jgi:hypothetical protein
MDTSNSEKETFRPVDFVLGRKIKQSELTQDDWVRIIYELMGHVKPRLKYVSGMVEFRKYMNRDEKGSRFDAFFATSEDMLDRVQGMSVHPRLQFIELCSVHCESPSLKLFSTPHHTELLHDHNILLTREGDLILQFCNYESRKGGDNWKRHYNTESIFMRPIIPVDLALTCMHEGVFTESTEFGRGKGVGTFCEGAIICDALYALIQRTLADKEKYMEELRDVLSEIDTVQNLIEGFPNHKVR